MRVSLFKQQTGYGTMQDLELADRTNLLTEQDIQVLPLFELLDRCQAQAPAPMDSLNQLMVAALLKRLGQEFLGNPAADLTTQRARYAISACFQADNLKVGLESLIRDGVAKLHPERLSMGRIIPIVSILFVASLLSGLSGKYWTLVPISLAAFALGSRLLYEHNCDWKSVEHYQQIQAAKNDLDANKPVDAVNKLYPLTQRFSAAELWPGVYPGVRVLAVKRIFQGLAEQASDLQTYVMNLIQALAVEQEKNCYFANAVRLGS